MCMVMAAMWWSVSVYRGVVATVRAVTAREVVAKGAAAMSKEAAAMVAVDKPIGRRW